MKQRQQSSTSYPILFLLVSSTDHVTAVTGLTPTVTISKNGAAFASPAGAVSEVGNGWYALAGNATDRGTVGELLIHATGTAADPCDDRYAIVPWDPFDVHSALLDLAAGVETGITPRQALRVMLAALAGKADGAATTTMHFRDQADAKNRITATVDADGNRTAVTLDAS